MSKKLQDRTLLLDCIVRGIARVDRWDEERAEVAVSGMRYGVELDRDGCPVLHGHLSVALAIALADARTAPRPA